MHNELPKIFKFFPRGKIQYDVKYSKYGLSDNDVQYTNIYVTVSNGKFVFMASLYFVYLYDSL